MATSPAGPPGASSGASVVDSGGVAGTPALLGTIEHVEVGPLVRGADGLPLPPGMAEAMIGPPPPLPAADPRHYVCLRGPCRHLWQIEAHFDSGNPAETWDPTRGLREGQIQCPDCAGTGNRPQSRPLASPGARVCDYQPRQGANSERRCLLVEDHEGAHHYGDQPPLPTMTSCGRCFGYGVIADLSSKAIRQPRKITRSCTYQPGVEQDLDDTVVYACDWWDPRPPDPELEARRAAYFERHPDHKPTE